MVRIWDGGLAIYGGVIMAVVVLLVFCKVRQIRFLAFADLGVFGMLIGQMIGRWGNFVNIEAYGGPTELPWRMGIYAYVDGVRQYMEVHPTFLYESLWNLLGFALLVQIARRWRKFDGQMFLSYFAWYAWPGLYRGPAHRQPDGGPLPHQPGGGRGQHAGGAGAVAGAAQKYAGVPLMVTYTAVEKGKDGPVACSVSWPAGQTPSAAQLRNSWPQPAPGCSSRGRRNRAG